MRFLIPLGVLLLVCGCGSTPSTHATASAPPAGADAATVVFFRAKCPPVAVKGALSIDGVEHGAVGVRRYMRTWIAPGKHELKYAFPLWAGTPSKKLIIEVAPNTTRYFYYTTDMGFLVGAPVPTTTITPELIEVSEENGKRLLMEFEPAR